MLFNVIFLYQILKQLVMVILHFKDYGDTENDVTDAVLAVRGADHNTDFSFIALLFTTFQLASGLLIP